MTRLILCWMMILTLRPLAVAQMASTERNPLVRSNLSGVPRSKAGGPIVGELVDPFTTKLRLDRILEFLKAPCVLQWDADTTLREIHSDLSRYVPVELDIQALEDSGLSVESAPMSDTRGREEPRKQTRHGVNASLRSGGSNDRWWSTEPARTPITNGARLFHYLDRYELTLNLQNGQLKITTLDGAADCPLMQIYDVTPLWGHDDRFETAAFPEFVNQFRMRRGQSLLALIEYTVAPGSWDSMGGSSTMVPFKTGSRRWLVVSAPLMVQWQIEGLLSRLNR